jgi:hypothetical protein
MVVSFGFVWGWWWAVALVDFWQGAFDLAAAALAADDIGVGLTGGDEVAVGYGGPAGDVDQVAAFGTAELGHFDQLLVAGDPWGRESSERTASQLVDRPPIMVGPGCLL